MSLVECPGCKKLISDRATNCINCGLSFKLQGIITEDTCDQPTGAQIMENTLPESTNTSRLSQNMEEISLKRKIILCIELGIVFLIASLFIRNASSALGRTGLLSEKTCKEADIEAFKGIAERGKDNPVFSLGFYGLDIDNVINSRFSVTEYYNKVLKINSCIREILFPYGISGKNFRFFWFGFFLLVFFTGFSPKTRNILIYMAIYSLFVGIMLGSIAEETVNISIKKAYVIDFWLVFLFGIYTSIGPRIILTAAFVYFNNDYAMFSPAVYIYSGTGASLVQLALDCLEYLALSIYTWKYLFKVGWDENVLKSI